MCLSLFTDILLALCTYDPCPLARLSLRFLSFSFIESLLSFVRFAVTHFCHIYNEPHMQCYRSRLKARLQNQIVESDAVVRFLIDNAILILTMLIIIILLGRILYAFLRCIEEFLGCNWLG